MIRKPFKLMLLLAVLLSACADKENLVNCYQQTEVVFLPSINAYPTRTTNGGDEWNEGDEVGIYMKLPSEDIFNAQYKNFRYLVSPKFDASEGWLRAGDKTDSTIYFPQSMSPVDFIAYYPYNSDIIWTDCTLPVNINNQNNQEILDILYASKSISSYNTSDQVVLPFRHKMAKLRFEISISNGTVANLKNVKTKLYGIPDTAYLHLATGLVTATGAPSSIVPKNMGVAVGKENDEASLQCIIIPHDGDSFDDRQLLIITDDKTYTWNISDRTVFEENKIYTYRISLSGNKVVELSGNITPWDDDTDEEVNASENTVPASGTASFVQLADGTIMETVYIRKGSFTMGSPVNEFLRTDSSETQHKVTLTKDFMMGKYEVTNEQFASFLNAIGIAPNGTGTDGLEWVKGTAQESLSGLTFANGEWKPVTGKKDHPVSFICWHAAKAYTEWAGKGCRLPTEEEWEYACRGGTQTAYFYGKDTTKIAEYVCYQLTSKNSTARVGSFKPNSWGLYDMCGNVFEMCIDTYAADYKNPKNTNMRSLRGGSYSSVSRTSRSAYRSLFDAKLYASVVGFRVVFDTPKPI